MSPIVRGHWAESFGTIEEHARDRRTQAQMNVLANGVPFTIAPTAIPADWTFQDECDYQEYLRKFEEDANWQYIKDNYVR